MYDEIFRTVEDQVKFLGYIDLEDVPKLMMGAVERIMNGPELRTELRERGLKQAEKFRWEETERKT